MKLLMELKYIFYILINTLYLNFPKNISNQQHFFFFSSPPTFFCVNFSPLALVLTLTSTIFLTNSLKTELIFAPVLAEH